MADNFVGGELPIQLDFNPFLSLKWNPTWWADSSHNYPGLRQEALSNSAYLGCTKRVKMRSGEYGNLFPSLR